MPNRLRILCFSLLLSLPFASKATHIVGGEMTYTCLGNNLYEIKLTIFRDCYNGVPWFDDPASIGIFRNSNNSLFLEIQIDTIAALNDTLNPELGSECFVLPPNVCVHTMSYTGTAFIPFDPQGYHIVYQRCCRNITISNLIAPEDVGATYSIIIGPQALQECNSSPVFNNWPPLFLCVNQPFAIDQSAVDPDGDSLAYRLCDPFTGADPIFPIPQPPNPPPYSPVPWLAPYNVNNQIGGTPAMAIDPISGLLTGKPDVVGQFVIGICVDEFRNGVLIGSKRRDYQVNIGICDIATAAFFAPKIICESFTVSTQNQSQSANDFIWYFNDPNNPVATSTLPNPTYTYSDSGLYTIVLIAEPGTVCSDTFSADVHILLNSLFANFSVVNADCADSLSIDVVDSSIDTISNIANWEWTLTQGTNSWTTMDQNPSFVLHDPGDALLTLIVTADNGCMDTLQQNFPVFFIEDPLLDDSTDICFGNGNVQLNPDGAFPGATYNWTPPENLDNPNSPNPIANPTETTTYTVSIDDANGFCHVEKTVTIIVSPDVSVTPVLDTILQGQSVPILATYDPSYTYSWSPANWLDNADINDPTSTPDEDVTYILTVTDSNGCVVERTVVIVVLALCEEPYVFIPTGFTPNNDGKNDVFHVIGNNLAEVHLIVYNRWGEKIFESNDPSVGWDGTYKGKLLPPDAYGFYAEVTCLGGLKFFKKGNVTLVR
ncbi:MAG: gliding motility-associated C-terminal domain-containing protein [Saprospiraceae bacterium]|nr:gliding motility-associated C-terminal domain-containing protein [Saprospiraceae bacterium]MCF8252490.1 gliding motility-associated C-terminal domain-containing protein [Saprospiraceae bacterium]MCF8282491.1 gliding motility-associated C-terminal domain-containing protein [Bacteroidales bacterium]MCF8312643.1 gliding motility-associated C-terminal domain-containing protein [Saprospiraceae bacterium]MCF8441091.1 gliding motility-associated C-terminal domain-containing protein [Saprospiraceae 